MRLQPGQSGYEFRAQAIEGDNIILEDLLSRVVFDDGIFGKITLYIYLSEIQYERISRLNAPTISGKSYTPNGAVANTFFIERAYFHNSRRNDFGGTEHERVIECGVSSIQITGLPSQETTPTTIKVCYWLSPCSPLEPQKTLDPVFTGEIKLVRNYKHEVHLCDNVSVSFDTHFDFRDKGGGVSEQRQRLVAETEFSPKDHSPLEVFTLLSNFLGVVSFATQYRCICVGWETWSEGKHSQVYLRDIALPDANDEEDFHFYIVPPQEILSFSIHSYQHLQTHDTEKLLGQALLYLTGHHRSLEWSFLKRYAAIESMVLDFEKKNGLQQILDDQIWARFRKSIEKFIRKDSPIAGEGNKDNRRLIYDKLPELNRISLQCAYRELIKSTKLTTPDLWPLFERDGGPSLADLRNHLIHGNAISNEHHEALSRANKHLHYQAIQIAILLLKWPIEKSYYDGEISLAEPFEKVDWLILRSRTNL